MMKRNSQHWLRLLRKYRGVQARLIEQPNSRLRRKIRLITRRLRALNRKWKLGISATALSAWLALVPAQVIAQNFPSVLDPSSLNGSNGFAIRGEELGDRAGDPVRCAGDVNGDGIDDLIIGANRASPNGLLSGASYVVFGNSNGFIPSFELSNLTGSNGFVMNGVAADDYAGFFVDGVGDVNGDGLDDVIVGALRADPNGDKSGASYVVFGRDNGFPSAVELSALNGNNGFAIHGVESYDHAGVAVSAAGDINGDGIDDFLIGAFRASANGPFSGASYVVFGSNTGFSSTFELSSLDGSNGFAIPGGFQYDALGKNVSAAGDVNGDGLDDIVVGAPYSDPNGTKSGTAYVVFGKSGSFSSPFDLSSLDGNNGFAINGVYANNYIGFAVNDAGDVNGDGVDDIILGAFAADPHGTSSGTSYVVFGSKQGFSAEFELSGLDGDNGFAIHGIAGDDRSGYSVSGAGDINGDGADDVIIGANRADPGGYSSGASYVVFGSNSGFAPEVELSSLDGGNGFTINGTASKDWTGRSVSRAGDMNGDGVDDIVIGAFGSPGGLYYGASYVIFGRANAAVAPVVANAIQDQSATAGAPFTFKVPDFTFQDNNPQDVLTLSASLSGGGSLPGWLTFNPTTNTFSGTPGNGDVGIQTITVTATDKDNLAVSDDFDLTVKVDQIVGLDDQPEGATKLYPNPAKEQITFSMQNGFIGKIQVSILSLAGKRMYQHEMFKNSEKIKITINPTDLQPGMYLLEVYMNQKRTAVYRVLME